MLYNDNEQLSTYVDFVGELFGESTTLLSKKRIKDDSGFSFILFQVKIIFVDARFQSF